MMPSAFYQLPRKGCMFFFFLLYPLFTKLLIAVTLNHTYAIYTR